jgi:hypothetical protein
MKKCNPLALVVQIGCTISADGLHRFESQLFSRQIGYISKIMLIFAAELPEQLKHDNRK